MPALVTSRSAASVEALPAPETASLLHLLPAAKQYILAVCFRAADGRRWRAVGGGTTIASAIEWARDCCPADTVWETESWNDLYGE